jgi:hypothetical protein
MKDFTKKTEEKTFRIDGDVFQAARAIPAEILAEFATKFSDVANTPTSSQFQVFAEALDLVLLPESYELIRRRMKDKENPVELDQLSDIIVWLLGEYGLRPTQPLSSSLDGQHNQESGTNLTGQLLPGESISTLSPVNAS